MNPVDDSFSTVYQAVTMDEYREMQKDHVFPIPRAIAVYHGSLIASVTQEDGAHIIAYTPSDADFNADGSFKGIDVENGNALRNPAFKEIAEQSKELLNYPAYHMYDANYGGTVYQMIEYNDKLYMAINAGHKDLHSTKNTNGTTAVDAYGNETKCYAGYAILEGSLKRITITLDGLGDDSNQTMRNFAITKDYVVFIPGNAIRGGSVYRLTEWSGMSDNDKPDPNPESYTVTIKDAGEGATGEGEYTQGSTVELYAGTKEGFVFNGWTSDKNVTINNAKDAKASFVMIDHDVTVTANWKEKIRDTRSRSETRVLFRNSRRHRKQRDRLR